MCTWLQLHFCRTAAQEHLTDLVGVCCCPLWGKTANPNGIVCCLTLREAAYTNFKAFIWPYRGSNPPYTALLRRAHYPLHHRCVSYSSFIYLLQEQCDFFSPSVSWQWKHGKLKLDIKTQIFTLLTLDKVKIQTKWRHYMLGDNTKHSWKSFSYCLKIKL